MPYTLFFDKPLTQAELVAEWFSLLDHLGLKDSILAQRRGVITLDTTGESASLNLPHSWLKKIKTAAQEKGVDSPLSIKLMTLTFLPPKDALSQTLNEAEAFYRNEFSPRTSQPIDSALPAFDHLLPWLLCDQKAKKIVLATSHGHFGHHVLLQNNAKLLAELNASVVIENLCDTSQEEIDRCRKERHLSNLLASLLPELGERQFKHANDFSKLTVKLLIEQGVQLIAGETETTNAIRVVSHRDAPKRIAAMNYVMATQADQYRKEHNLQDSPVIYLVGEAHATYFKSPFATMKTVPGLKELTGGVVVNILDKKALKEHKLSVSSKNEIKVRFCTKKLLDSQNGSKKPSFQEAASTTPFFPLKNSSNDLNHNALEESPSCSTLTTNF